MRIVDASNRATSFGLLLVEDTFEIYGHRWLKITSETALKLGGYQEVLRFERDTLVQPVPSVLLWGTDTAPGD